jgi:hypothetical protein
MSRYTIKFSRVLNDDVHHLLNAMIFYDVCCQHPIHVAKSAGPNPEMDSYTDVVAKCNFMHLDMVVNKLHDLPVCVFSKISSIEINQI